MPKQKPTRECFIAVLLVISKTWKQSRDTSIDEQTVVESYNRTLFRDTKKRVVKPQNNMEEPYMYISQ